MALTKNHEGQIKVLADIGKLVPDLFAVFEMKGLRMAYINPAGSRLLDPQGGGALEKMSLPDLIGVNGVDRFQREIFLQTQVIGSWTGSLVLRDVQGSEFEFQAKFLDASNGAGGSEQSYLYLYASLAKTSADVPSVVSSDHEMLHALLDTTPDRVVFKDMAGRYLRISRAKAIAHDVIDPREMIGKTDFDFFSIEHSAKAFEEEQTVLKTGEAMIDREGTLTYDDGRIVWVSTTRMPFRSREGKLVGTFCISRDITARKLAEEAIRKSEAVLRGTFNAAPVGISLVEDRVIRKVNDLLCEISGYCEEDLVGRSSSFLYFDEKEFLRVGQAFENSKNNHGTSTEATWRRADGRPIEVLLSVARLENDDSKKWRIVTVFDMTEKKHAERALREKEAHLSEAQRIAHFGSWKRDLVTNELTWSDETHRIFGWPPEKPVSHDDFLRLIHPEDLAQVEERHIKALTEDAPIEIEYRIVRASGEVRYVNEYGINTTDAEGRPIKLEGTILDITERKKATQERREMETRLQLAQKLESVGMLAAGVAHEINTPTQYITDNTRFLTGAFAQIFRVIESFRALSQAATARQDCTAALASVAAAEIENELDYMVAEVPRTLEQSLEGLNRISRIVSSLKEFSHPNAVEKSVADLNRAIETTIAVSRHEWKYVADVVTELDPTMPNVNCILDEFNQAILNLVINAAHAVGDANKKLGLKRGRITIRTRQEAGHAIIEVADTGTGIPPEIRNRIFEPFFTTKGIGKGTGQGLAIVRSVIVKGHQGEIDFTTEIGRGTTFRISLPLSPPASHSTQTSTPLSSRAD